MNRSMEYGTVWGQTNKHKKLMNAITTQAFELVTALSEAVVDTAVALEVGNKARRQEVVGGNAAQAIPGEQLVGSKILELLYSEGNKATLLSSSGISHVFYAPPSTGKTIAFIHFVSTYLKSKKAPAIMVSGVFPSETDYLIGMAIALGIPKKGDVSYNFHWIKSLLAGLLPREKEILQHAPVLILDEFNSPGPNRTNILFAEVIARYFHGKGVTLIFVTQNEEVARDICQCNAWQKVGPLPGLTIPDRISDPLPPPSYEWKDMKWSQRSLKQMISKLPKYRDKFDATDVDVEGNFTFLEGISHTTTAILAADRHLASKVLLKTEDVAEFEDGFFDDC